MSDGGLVPRAAVLRCSRCGRFADWQHAHVQVVCECRPRLEIPPALVREASDDDRTRAMDIFDRELGGRPLFANGAPVAIDTTDVLVAETEDGVVGALASRRFDGGLHIVALATDPLWQRSGVGGCLLAEAEMMARRQSLTRIVATVSNDNIPALYFYQRRGFRLSSVLPDSFAAHRHDATGFAGIPIRDEVQLTKEIGPT